MQRIIIVNSRDDYEAFRKANVSGQEFQVYTFSPRACLDLRLAGIPALTLSQNISAAEAESIYREAFEEAARIVEASSSAQGDGAVNLARLFKPYYWELLVNAGALDTVLKKWDGGPDFTLYYVKRNGQPPAKHELLVEPLPLAFHMFQADYLSGRAKPVILTGGAKSNLMGRILDWSAQRKSAILQRLPVRRLNKEFPTGKRAIGWGSGYDALIVAPEMLRIAEETGMKPLWVTDWIDSSTNRTGLVYKESYDSIDRFPTSRFLTGVSKFTKNEHLQVEEAFNGLLKAFDTSETGAKYQLSSLLKGLRSQYYESFLLARRMEEALRRWVGSAIALTHFNGLPERIIEQLAPRYGITVHARQHGWIGIPELTEFKADEYIVPGRLQAEFMRKFFNYGDEVVIRPDINVNRTADEWLSKNEEERKAISGEKRSSSGIKAKYVVAVLTTMARSYIPNELDYPVFEDCWENILKYTKAHPELYIIVKGHPKASSNYNTWVSGMAARQEVTNISVSSGPLEETLTWADFVIDLGKPGTATIVTLLFNKPLLIYSGLYKYVSPFTREIIDAGRAFSVDTPEALIKELDNLILQGDTYLRDMITRNRILLDGLTVRKM